MNSYVAIRSEGGLIPVETIEKAVRKELPGQADADFGLERGRRLSDEIARAWSDALDYWHIFRRRMEALPAPDPGTTLTRERWVLLLLTDLLGYGLTYQSAGVQISGKTYPISHRAGEGEEALPVHIVGFRQDLDRRDESGHRRMSPHALVQEYVNRSEHLWAVVTNGLRFRLLRDTTRTARPTYLEFDLQSILDGGRFNEFAVFYRFCHRTRLPKTIGDAKDCLLEQYYQDSIDEGLRIRDRLRDAVEVALKRIGTGLLQHPANDSLRQNVASNQLTAEAYYRQLLRLIYRLLFLMVAEERQMVLVPGTDAERRQRVYDRFYSLRRQRDLAEQPIEDTPYDDVWTGLQATFQLFTNGRENPLGMPSLNGHLFGPEAIPDLEGTHLYNHDLLVAIRRMSVFEADGTATRVNHAGLDVEELGSVYESLLDFHPTIERQNGALAFDLKTGIARKSTGSYYTPRELVSELIESALVPVLEGRLATAKTREEKEKAILTMTVCDPACGSGHFLLAAARRMARELAKVRSDEDEPTPEEFRRALRDVIQQCVYGVDKNPLAVDLCKVALWIEGHSPGLPLSFLDHRIKCGDSLVGVFSLEKLAEGITDEAYVLAFGDDKEVVKRLRRRNAQERKSQGRQLSLTEQLHDHIVEYAEALDALAALPQETVAQVHEMELRYRKMYGEDSSTWRDWVAVNVWTAAFFMPLTGETEDLVPTTSHVRDWLAGMGLPAAMGRAVNTVARDLRFFHWPLEFPEVFARGGFDVVLGNPPWDMLQLDPADFFLAIEPSISEAGTTAERERLLRSLAHERPDIYETYAAARRIVDRQQEFMRVSGRFPLTSYGRINLAPLFAELARLLTTDFGRAGMVVPTGIATDAFNQYFFSDIIEREQLASLFDFENRARLFPDVDGRYRFALLTLSNRPAEQARFAFFCTHPDDLRDERRLFPLTRNDFALFNPNTLTCPVLRTRADAELARRIYRSIPVLVNEKEQINPWGIRIQRMFMMNTDSHLFSREPRAGRVPLLEGKMVQAYDYRAASIVYVARNRVRQSQSRTTTLQEHLDPTFQPRPLWYVPVTEVDARMGSWARHWLVGFKEITSATNERTVISTVLPRVGVGHKIPLLFAEAAPSTRHVACLLANLNSLVLDYIARLKIGGTSLSDFILKQLPVLPPKAYAPDDVHFVSDRVLELTFTSLDLGGFARDCDFDQEPFRWDVQRRAMLLADLDAYFAHLYGLSRDELRYVLDPEDVFGEGFPGETFRGLKETELDEHGEYRTRQLVLDAYDELAKTRRFGIAPPSPSHPTH